jgi:hypothetical protein
MGKTKGPYNCEFPMGTVVRVRDRGFLDKFQREWKYHHKITSEQIEYAGKTGIVARAMIYHGGDELYELEAIPGIWHEQCLCLDAEV